MTLDVAILVDDVAILINCMTDKPLRVAFGKLADTVAVIVFDKSVLDDTNAFISSVRALRALRALTGRNELSATDKLACVAVDMTLTVRLASGKFAQVTFDELSNWNALAVDQVTLLVEGQTIQDG